jgi:hypothetical protein
MRVCAKENRDQTSIPASSLHSEWFYAALRAARNDRSATVPRFFALRYAALRIVLCAAIAAARAISDRSALLSGFFMVVYPLLKLSGEGQFVALCYV